LSKKFITTIITSILMLSILSTSSQVAGYYQNWATDIGVGVEGRADIRFPGFGEGVHSRFEWEIDSFLDTPLIKGVTIYAVIGEAADFFDVAWEVGNPIFFLPPNTLQGALKMEIEMDRLGKIPVYKKIVDWNGLRGEAYYDQTSCIAVRGDLAGVDANGNEVWFNFWLIDASSRMVNPVIEKPSVSPAPPPKETIMGLDPMAFYTIIIVLAIAVVGAVIALSMRRRPYRYPSSPPPPPPPPPPH
jgi:hypothetical protein